MENEEQVDLELEETQAPEQDRNINRTRQLADKLKAEGEAKAKAEAEAKAAAQERDFYKGFNVVSTKYQSAAEYQDKILEKVKAGYDLEDATVAILSREGKLNQSPVIEQAPAPQPKSNPAGGSAVTNAALGGEKKPGEMSLEELRSALIEAEKRGDLGMR